MELLKRDDGDVQFYTVALTGQSGMSQTGLAILAGVTRTRLQRLEDTLAHSAPSEYLEPFVGKDFTLARTEDNVTVDGKPVGNIRIYKSSFCAAVLKHYADIEKEEKLPERPATYSLLNFAEKGIDKWIQDITGWTQYRDSIQPHTDVYIQRIQHMRDHQISDDLWMVFREASELLIVLEMDWQVPINDYDILDGSIGQRWMAYREGKDWAGRVGSYKHNYRDQRGTRDCNAFGVTELPYFKHWLRSEYVPKWLPAYLCNKYGKRAALLIYTENGMLNDEILALTEIKRIAPKEEEKFQAFLSARQALLLPPSI